MTHPLQGSLSKDKDDDLHKKISDLQSKLMYAHRVNNADMIRQLNMFLLAYQEEVVNRNIKKMSELEGNTKEFKYIIDIK